MTQHIDPMWGSLATTNVIAKTGASRHGIVIAPVVTFGGSPSARTAIITPPASPGFFAWRTFWEIANGSHVVIEDAVMVLGLGADPSAGNRKNVLIVGRWKFDVGTIGSDGKPTESHVIPATYDVVAGTAGANPTDPSYSQPDTNGCFGVVLGRAVLSGDTGPIWEWLPQTFVDPGALGEKIKVLEDWIAAPEFPADGFKMNDHSTSNQFQFRVINGVLTQEAL